MSKIGKNIRKIRITKGLSQTAFANLFDITRASVGAYEEGRAEPKTDVVIKMAKHFSISLEDFLTKEVTVNDLNNFDLKKIIEPKASHSKKVALLNKHNWLVFYKGDIADIPHIDIPFALFESDYLIQTEGLIENENPSFILCSKSTHIHENDSYLVINTIEDLEIKQGHLVAEGDNYLRIDYTINKAHTVSEKNIENRLNQLEIAIAQMKKQLSK